MAVVADLVHEVSTSTGAGVFTVVQVNGRQRFATAFGTGSTTDVFYYYISSRDAAEYEWGTGHMSATTTLVRDTVLGGSNGTSAVSFSAGTKDVTCDVPADLNWIPTAADKFVYSDAAGSIAEGDITAAGRAILDDADAAAQRTTLELGDAATKNVGTTAGTVAAGDDSRITGAAPNSAEYLVGASSSGLSAERVVTNTSTVTWDLATAGQAKANVVGLTIGTDVQAYDADLTAVAELSSTGLIARTGSGVAAARTLTGPVAGITVSNGDGVSGNPTLALADDLAAVEGLTSTGIVRRTGTNTWSAGTDVDLTSEVTGILPSANGGVLNETVIDLRLPPYSITYGSSIDNSAKFWQAWNALQAAGGGTIVVTGHLRIDDCIALTGATIKPVRITGMAPTWDGSLEGTAAIVGAVLDLRYTGADTLHPAKMDLRSKGLLEIDHITITSGGSDNLLFIYQTNTVLHLHHYRVVGNAANAGTSCVQDFIVHGGTSTSYGTTAVDDAFQAYGTSLADGLYSRIRRIATFRSAANSISYVNIAVDKTCGSSETFAAPFQLIGIGFGNEGFSCVGGTYELYSYKYLAALTYTNAVTRDHSFLGVNAWDVIPGTFVGYFYIAANTGGVFWTGYRDATYSPTAVPAFTGPGATASSNVTVDRFGVLCPTYWGGEAVDAVLAFKPSRAAVPSGDAMAFYADGVQQIIVSAASAIFRPPTTFGDGLGYKTLIVDGGAASGEGAYIGFKRGSADPSYVGHHSLLLGGTSSDLIGYYGGVGWRVKSGGTLAFPAYGAGTLTTDASGNVSVTSDATLKTISGDFTAGLKAIVGIRPKVFYWNAASGMDQLNPYAGLIAQDVEAAIPEAVGEDERGRKTLSDRVLISALINAVRELHDRITTLETRNAK